MSPPACRIASIIHSRPITVAPIKPQRTFAIAPPTRYGSLLVVVAQHRKEAQLDLSAQKLVMPAEPFLLIGQVQMHVERCPVGPVLVKVEDVRVLAADVEMIFDAAGLRARSRDKAFEQFDELGSLLRPCVQCGGEGASGRSGHWPFLPLATVAALALRSASRQGERSSFFTSCAARRARAPRRGQKGDLSTVSLVHISGLP